MNFSFLRWVFLTLILLTTVQGCLDMNGGAVEGGWDLRFPDGRSVDDDGNSINCQKTKLKTVLISVISEDSNKDPCNGEESCRFPCVHAGIGTTDFFIPPGLYSISLQLEDSSGVVVGPGNGVVVPSPVLRQVEEGKITDLNVNLIIVDR